MDGRNKNEMEQIQRGLEEFLKKELGADENAGDNSAAGAGGERERQPEAADVRAVGQERQGNGTGRPREPDDEEIYSGRRNRGDSEESPEKAYSRFRGEEYGGTYRGDRREEYGGAYRDDRREEYDQTYRDDWEEEEAEVEVVDWDLAGSRASAGKPSGSSRGGGNRGSGRTSGSRSAGGNGSGRTSGSRSAGGNGSGRTPGSRSAGGNGSGRTPGSRGAEESGSGRKPRRKKGSRWKARLFKLLIAAVLIVALLGFGLYQLVGLAYGKMNYREIASFSGKPMQEDGVVNILLIGNDSRENGEDGRSDAMILLSISKKTKSIYMTSILRDIYVDIPGRDGNRLNAAYSFGGAELLMETIEKNFDISVNRYVLVNFEAFAGLVDAVGGIELELTSQEIEYVNGYLVEYNMLTNRPQGTDNMDPSVSGLVHLNGPQALAYSRNRYLGTDFGRTERQRKVLTAVIEKLPKAVLTNTGGLIDGLMSNLTTNLTQYECFRLCLMAGKLLTYDIVSDSIPQPGTYQNVSIRGMSVLEVDFKANIDYLKEKIYGE